MMYDDSTCAKNHTVFICGIDAVKEKNIHQIQGLSQRGYRFVILTTDSTGFSERTVNNVTGIRLYKTGRRYIVLSMLKQALHILWRERPSLIEIYPYSHFAFIVALLCKLARIPVLIVARGEELKYVEGKMSAVRRIFFRCTYALADGVIYKELYMPKMLDSMRKRVRWHLPNAIKLPEAPQRSERKGCTFLYMNTIKPFRHPEICLEAFIKICQKHGLDAESDVKLIIVGLSGTVSSPETRAKEKRLHELVEGRNVPVELHKWTNDPSSYLKRADVFLLPAEIVYVNYSLLEAMGIGIPAIIQKAPGSEKLVTHGREGYVAPMCSDAWARHMSELAFDNELRIKMGKAAREKVVRDFTFEKYIRRYSSIYDYYINEGIALPDEY